MAPRGAPEYKPIGMQFGIPEWFSKPREYDLYGEIAALQNAEAVAKDRELAAMRAGAQLDANRALSDPSYEDPYAAASDVLEKAGMLEQADKYRSRNTDRDLDAVERANKLAESGFIDEAKKLIAESGLDAEKYSRKSKKELRELDPEKDLYQVENGQATLIRPGQKKDKEGKPNYVTLFDLDGNDVTVDKKSSEYLKAKESGYIIEGKPLDSFEARELRKQREVNRQKQAESAQSTAQPPREIIVRRKGPPRG